MVYWYVHLINQYNMHFMLPHIVICIYHDCCRCVYSLQCAHYYYTSGASRWCTASRRLTAGSTCIYIYVMYLYIYIDVGSASCPVQTPFDFNFFLLGIHLNCNDIFFALNLFNIYNILYTYRCFRVCSWI
jgi:hypothetical protein